MKNNNRQIWNSLAMVLQFSIQMLVPIVLCTFFGVWLGNKVDKNWMAIPFFFLGALAGLTNMIRMAKQIAKQDEGRKR